MADFLQSVMAQRRMAQQRAMQQQVLQQRAMQQRSLEEQRQRQWQQQQAVQQRIMGQNEIGNNLAERGLRAREDENRSRETDRRRTLDRLDLASRRGTLKPGYRWKQDDQFSQELIPGGPEWTKLRAAHAEDLAKLQSINEASQDIVQRTGRVLQPGVEGGFNANFGGYNALLTKHFPEWVTGFKGTQDVKAELEGLEKYRMATGLGDIRGRTGQSV